MREGFLRTAGTRGFPCPWVRRAQRIGSIWLHHAEANDPSRDAYWAISEYLAVVARQADPTTAALSVLVLGLSLGTHWDAEDARDYAWSLLNDMHDQDRLAGYGWPPQIPTQMEDPHWAYCLRTVPLFVNISSSALAARRSRNLGYDLTLVIQPRAGIDLIAPPGTAGQSARERIRRRIDRYDDLSRSPALGSYGCGFNQDWRQFWLGDSNDVDAWRPPIVPLACPEDRCPSLPSSQATPERSSIPSRRHSRTPGER